MGNLHWRVGIELELLAPPGKSRLDLAEAIRHHCQGSIRRFFHPQSEPSKVSGMPIFHNLTLGYAVYDPKGDRIAQCVDDLTLQADLNRGASPKPDWYRIVSDDERLLRLIQCQTDPSLPLGQVMAPIAKLFGTEPEQSPGGMIRVNDQMGASIAIAAPLPGERERPCELITAPIETHHVQQIEQLLAFVRDLNFTAPMEGATHFHFDATRLQSANAIANLVNLLWAYGDGLKTLLQTNPHCRRLGHWPGSLLETVNAPDFRALPWEQAQTRLKTVELTKYCDFNLVNCIHQIPNKNTIETRILPVYLDSQPLIKALSLWERVLEWAIATDRFVIDRLEPYGLESISTLLEMLPE
jgi:hypothetical protein